MDSKAALVPCLSLALGGRFLRTPTERFVLSLHVPGEMLMEKLTAAMPGVYLPVSSALFHSLSADLHLPVILVLHLCTEVPQHGNQLFILHRTQEL